MKYRNILNIIRIYKRYNNNRILLIPFILLLLKSYYFTIKIKKLKI